LSETDGGEYSIKAKPGKWYYYEHHSAVAMYGIFEPEAGWLSIST